MPRTRYAPSAPRSTSSAALMTHQAGVAVLDCGGARHSDRQAHRPTARAVSRLVMIVAGTAEEQGRSRHRSPRARCTASCTSPFPNSACGCSWKRPGGATRMRSSGAAAAPVGRAPRRNRWGLIAGGGSRPGRSARLGRNPHTHQRAPCASDRRRSPGRRRRCRTRAAARPRRSGAGRRRPQRPAGRQCRRAVSRGAAAQCA